MWLAPYDLGVSLTSPLECRPTGDADVSRYPATAAPGRRLNSWKKDEVLFIGQSASSSYLADGPARGEVAYADRAEAILRARHRGVGVI
jgi:hypothetical protein